MIRRCCTRLWVPRYRWAQKNTLASPSIPRRATAQRFSAASRVPVSSRREDDNQEKKNGDGRLQCHRDGSHDPGTSRSSICDDEAKTLSSSFSLSIEKDTHDMLRRYRQCKSPGMKQGMKFDMKTKLVPRIVAACRQEGSSTTAILSPHQIATFLRLLALANLEDGRPIAEAYKLLWDQLRQRRTATTSFSGKKNTSTTTLEGSNSPTNVVAKDDLLNPNDVCAILSSGSRIGFLTDECLQMLLDHDVVKQLRAFTIGHLCELVVSIGRFSIRDYRFEKVAFALQRRRAEIVGTQLRPLQAVELIRQLSMARPRFQDLVKHLSLILLQQAKRGRVSTHVLHYTNKLLDAMDARCPELEEMFVKQASKKGVILNQQGDDDNEEESAALYDIVTADLVKIEHVR